METTSRFKNFLTIRTIKRQSSLKERSIDGLTPRTNEAVVHVSHISQNTINVDSLDTDALKNETVLGCDFVGEVKRIGSRVSKLKEGDIIAGLVLEGKDDHGDYSEYILADEDLCFQLPPSLSREEAVTVPVGACIAHLGLFGEGCLNIDLGKGPGATVLIWGGGSCVGRYAIQFAAMYRINVIAASTPGNFDLLKSLGATHTVDSRDKDALARIKELEPDLEYVLDAIGPSSTNATTLSQTLLNGRGNLCALHFSEEYALGVTSQTILTDVSVWKAFLHDHPGRSPSVGDHELSARLFRSLPRLLNDGRIKPNHPRVMSGGLQAVKAGPEVDRSGEPLDVKIAYEA